MRPNVFMHGDGTFSAPFCECGKNIVRQSLMRNVVVHTITDCCNTVGCTCSNDAHVERKANPIEAAEFYHTISQMAETTLYEVNHNL